MDPHPPVKSRRLALSLRGAILLVLAVALLLGWRANRARDQRLAVAAIRDYGGFVHYDWEFVNDKLTPGRKPPGPKWLRRMLGDEYFQEVRWVSFVYDDAGGKRLETGRMDDGALATLRGLGDVRELLLRGTQASDAAMAKVRDMPNLERLYMWDALELTDVGVGHLKGLTKLKHIHISNSRMSDAGLGHLATLPSLEEMSLQGNHFTDAGLAHLSPMTRLRQLYVGLGPTDITDAGMKALRGIRSLELVDIQKTKVTDLGLESLGALPNLKEIWVSETRITPEATAKLRAAIPKLKVIQ